MEKKETPDKLSKTTQTISKVSQIDLASLTPQVVNKRIRGLANVDLYELTYASTTPTMATLRRKEGFDKVAALIELYLMHLDEVLNLSRRLSRVATEAIAEDVYMIGFTLSIDELQRFFNELRQGKYGAIYQGLNSEVVCNGLRKYLNERQSYFAQKSEGESNKWKVRREKEGVEDLTADEMKERFDAMFNVKEK